MTNPGSPVITIHECLPIRPIAQKCGAFPFFQGMRPAFFRAAAPQVMCASGFIFLCEALRDCKDVTDRIDESSGPAPKTACTHEIPSSVSVAAAVSRPSLITSQIFSLLCLIVLEWNSRDSGFWFYGLRNYLAPRVRDWYGFALGIVVGNKHRSPNSHLFLSFRILDGIRQFKALGS